MDDATELATKRRTAEAPPLIPKISPHSLRRTYISVVLPANRFAVKRVMSHADSRMTMDIYAQFEQRVDRAHRVNFDRRLAAA